MASQDDKQFDSLATKWQLRFTKAESNQEKTFARFAEWYDAFNAVDTKRAAPWRSKPYIPLIAQQVWALVAKFSSLKPGFEVRIRDDGDGFADDELEERAAKAKKKLEYDYDCPYMDEPMRDKIAATLIDACVTGTGIAKVPYRTKMVKRYERMVDDSGIADLTKEKVFEKRVGFNDMEPVNIFNVFVSNATDKLGKGWLILRDYTPISELKSANEAKGGKLYQNLDKLSAKPNYGNFSTYNASRNRFLNDQEPSDDTTDIATTYECYEGDNIYTFAENKSGENKSWVLIRKSKNYYWHGKWPLVKFHVKKRPFSFWGQGLAELAYRLQVIYNDVFAHYLDGWNLSENPSFWAEENSNVDDYSVEPGSVNYYSGDKPPVPMTFNKPDPAALQMIVGLLNQAVEGVTASQYATGMTNSNMDNTKGTATGITKIQDAAGDIISYFRSNYTSCLLEVGKMWHSNNQQFMSQPVKITVTTKGKREDVQVSPADLQGDADVYVDEASMNPKSDEEKQQQVFTLTDRLLALQAASVQQQQLAGTDPLIINYPELADDLGDALGRTSINQVLMSQEEVDKALQKKGEELARSALNESMGLPDDPDEAAAQDVQALIDQGELDPEELANAGKEQSTWTMQ